MIWKVSLPPLYLFSKLNNKDSDEGDKKIGCHNKRPSHNNRRLGRANGLRKTGGEGGDGTHTWREGIKDGDTHTLKTLVPC